MDNLRGQFQDHDDAYDSARDFDSTEDEVGGDLPPVAIGQDERRMQVRAYNFWAAMLGERVFPSSSELDPASLSDFGPYSVLLDFTGDIENPQIAFLGDKLANECGSDDDIEQLNDVPSRSLLSRITDHYLQIIANQAPIGFEAEFVNQRGATILYRGILLPFSSDNQKIDFIYGVINWKELADQETADELLLQIDQALDPRRARDSEDIPMTDWADGPVDHGAIVERGSDENALPRPALSKKSGYASLHTGVSSEVAIPQEKAALGDWLALARDGADEAKASEKRTRQALYAAIGLAYDFSLAAAAQPDEFRVLAQESGLEVQSRSPMVPVAKLVFGIDYDKTRIAEVAAALDHGHRLGLSVGELAVQLGDTPGGLKAFVAEERRLRRIDNGKDHARPDREAKRAALAEKLRALGPCEIGDIPANGAEFTLLVARRTAAGDVEILGEVGENAALTEKAARLLVD